MRGQKWDTVGDIIEYMLTFLFTFELLLLITSTQHSYQHWMRFSGMLIASLRFCFSQSASLYNSITSMGGLKFEVYVLIFEMRSRLLLFLA